MSAFELEAMRSRNRVDAGERFLELRGMRSLMNALVEDEDREFPKPYSADERDRFSDEGRDPYQEVEDHGA